MSATFRANVGAVIANGSGRVLVLERSGHPGAWQFPQGGIEENEEPDKAVLREIEEETGIARDDLTLLVANSAWLAYELPDASRSEKTGRGQVQKWYLFRLADDATFEMPTKDEAEFTAFEWIAIDEAVARIVAFKRPVYEQVAEAFRPFLMAEATSLTGEGRAYALAELEHVTSSYLSNEEMGERRVANLVTFIALLATAVGLAAENLPQTGDVETLWLAFAASVAALAIGTLTFRRILNRNVNTTMLLSGGYRLRVALTTGDQLARLAMPAGMPSKRSFRWLRGGLAETVAVLNSLLVAAAATLVATHVKVRGELTATVAVAAAAFAAAAWLHHIAASRDYRQRLDTLAERRGSRRRA